MASNYSSESHAVFGAIDRAIEKADNIVSLSDGRLVLRLDDGTEVRVDVEIKRWYIPPKPGRKKWEKGQINKTAYKQKVDEIVSAIEAKRENRA